MLGVWILAKILLLIFWLFAGVPAVMVSIMAFDAPKSERSIITYIPITITTILVLISAWFFLFVW